MRSKELKKPTVEEKLLQEERKDRRISFGPQKVNQLNRLIQKNQLINNKKSSDEKPLVWDLFKNDNINRHL